MMETPKPSPLQFEKPKQLVCNFKAPDAEHFQAWQDFKHWCEDHGLDICRVNISLIRAFLESMKDPEIQKREQLATALGQIVNIEQTNTFIYSVEKPRRLPVFLDCAKPEFSRTISTRAAEAYVMERARELKRSFSYRDFLELGHGSFRKIVLRLKKGGKIVPLPQRSNPRFYVLAENLKEYPKCPRTLQ